jgi:peroxiredoxin
VTLLSAQQFQLGSRVDDFSIRDLSGNAVSFNSLKGDITVVTFVATECPVSNAYNTRMNALYKEYKGKGVKFIFVNSNVSEPAARVAEHAKAHFDFPVYKDPDSLIADRFGAQVTPEAYVIDKTGVIRYHGSIDDQRDESKVQVKGLQQALDALLGGKMPEVSQTKAFGCTIKRAQRTS